MFEKTGRSLRLLNFKGDQPNEVIGSLIPKINKKPKGPSKMGRFAVGAFKATTSLVVVAALFALGASGYSLVSKYGQVATPTVTIVDPETFNQVALGYGAHSAFSGDVFFSGARDAFIEEEQTFLEVDLDAKTLRYFENGVLTKSAEILSIGEEGSWWDAPSGLYKVEKKEEAEFSTVVQAYFPWTLTFEGNYTIHGWPYYPDKTPVPDSFVGGGVRVSDEDAQDLFAMANKGIPVLVHKTPTEPEAFVYQPIVPNVTAPHYLIADIENETVLAASDLDDAVPIASLTKLMTAVVAAEKMDLDARVQVSSPTFVQSLIPRLADRTSVSMYSLLRLLLVESSNEAAEVMAAEYGRDAFIAEMNTKATQLGMLKTSFSDPSGLSSENVSTLGDLFRLSKHIYHDRGFIFDITHNKEVTALDLPSEYDDLVNFNEVDTVDNFVGGKVGETLAAGQTSVSLHTVKIQGQERTVIVIMLGSSGRDADVETLVRYVTERFKRE